MTSQAARADTRHAEAEAVATAASHVSRALSLSESVMHSAQVIVECDWQSMRAWVATATTNQVSCRHTLGFAKPRESIIEASTGGP